MSSSEKITRKLAFGAILGATAAVFTAIEYILPIAAAVPLPGFRLGLANIVTVFAIRQTDFKTASAVTLVKVAVSALIAGTPTSFLYSLCGTVLSFVGMLLFDRLLKEKVGDIGICIAGAFLHNCGQIFVACLVTDGAAFAYFPYLCFVAVISGSVIGIVETLTAKAVKKSKTA